MTRKAPPADEASDLDGAEKAEEEEQRIELIARSMAEGRWSQRMASDLAERWELSVWKVRRYSAAASKRLRATLDPDELAATLLGRLELTYKAALGDQDYRGAVAALRVMADVAGFGGARGKDVAEKPKSPLDGLPREIQELAERTELLSFMAIHQRRPTQAQRAELLAGTRHPSDPCGHPGCPSCTRNAAPQPH
ncbi:MAG: hypothetical protein MUF64_11180 [Polyangiaceae bacterium]|jgi:hypothetical protein|nr:hypothetical protein [Polyangiaceae bacterium]